eukprot:TRINITY_DN8896_c0_g2_i1.p1 TRINITY_DN8896_c0_g2~~TRINITY_DN8896_c0_g2_i1.p1  ORF type:complete len:1258 (+),score=233.30 TRINITY_DN8896_c0_g2_i1:115-3888(+)
MAWELSKENVQPLKKGRNADLLNTALECQTEKRNVPKLLEERRALLQAIASYCGDDPLRPWLRYIKWVKESYPSSTHTELLPVLEECTRTFQKDGRYADDIRYLRVWIHYADCCAEPREIFQFLEANSIGQSHALFYEAYATFLELKRNYALANDIYSLGRSRSAEPTTRLSSMHKSFEERMAKRIQRKLQEGDEDAANPLGAPAFPAARTAFGNAVPLDSTGSGRAIARRGPPLKGSSTLNTGKEPRKMAGADLNVYVDPEFNDGGKEAPSVSQAGGLPAGLGSGTWTTLGSQAQRKKENTQAPSQWTNVKIPQRRADMKPPQPALEVFLDEEFSRADANPARVGQKAPPAQASLRMRLESADMPKSKVENLKQRPLMNFSNHNPVPARHLAPLVPALPSRGGALDLPPTAPEFRSTAAMLDPCSRSLGTLPPISVHSALRNDTSGRGPDPADPALDLPRPASTSEACPAEEVEVSFEETRLLQYEKRRMGQDNDGAEGSNAHGLGEPGTKGSATNSRQTGPELEDGIKAETDWNASIHSNGAQDEKAALQAGKSGNVLPSSGEAAEEKEVDHKHQASPPSLAGQECGQLEGGSSEAGRENLRTSCVPVQKQLGVAGEGRSLGAARENQMTVRHWQTCSPGKPGQCLAEVGPKRLHGLPADEVPQATAGFHKQQNAAPNQEAPETTGENKLVSKEDLINVMVDCEPKVHASKGTQLPADLKPRAEVPHAAQGLYRDGEETIALRKLGAGPLPLEQLDVASDDEEDHGPREGRHLALVDPTVNTKAALADIMSMFNKPLPCEQHPRKQASQSPALSAPLSDRGNGLSDAFEVFEDETTTVFEAAGGKGGAALILPYEDTDARGSPESAGKLRGLHFPAAAQAGTLQQKEDAWQDEEDLGFGFGANSENCPPAGRPRGLAPLPARTLDDLGVQQGVLQPLSKERARVLNVEIAQLGNGAHEGDDAADDFVIRTNIRSPSPLQEAAQPGRQHDEAESRTPAAPVILDPWNASLVSDLLEQLDPPLEEYEGYVACNSDPLEALSHLKRRSKKEHPLYLDLGADSFMVRSCIGAGAFARIFRAYRRTEDDTTEGDFDASISDDEAAYALKVQEPPCPWEFYVYRQVQHRVPKQKSLYFAQCHGMYVAPSCSLLLCELHDRGTLQDVVNAHLAKGQKMDELLCIFYTIEMLAMLETLHDAQIIHGDFKPDNLLLRDDDSAAWEPWTKAKPGCWAQKVCETQPSCLEPVRAGAHKLIAASLRV